MTLTRHNTDAIHMEGGSFLGISSVDADVDEIVKRCDYSLAYAVKCSAVFRVYVPKHHPGTVLVGCRRG